MHARVKILGAVAAAVMSAVALPGSASAAGTSVRACGYYETQSDAYYGHCTNTPGPTNGAYIKIDWDWTWFDSYRCVRPGETRLGSTSEIDGAYWTATCTPA